MTRRSLEAACLLTLILTSMPLPAGPSVALLGVSGGLGASSEAGEPADGAALLILSGSFSTREALSGGGYLSFLSSAACLLADWRDANDLEELRLKLALPAGPKRLELEAGWSSSLAGSPLFLRPDWRLGLTRPLGSGAAEVNLGATGAWEARPRDSEDVLWQEIRAGLKRRPSPRLHWESSVAFGLEHWGETCLVTSGGAELSDTRLDALVDLGVSLGGLWGYFADWSLGLDAAWRGSNANRYLDAVFDADSESRVSLSAEGELSWSPRHNISVELASYAVPELYLYREARGSDGLLRGEKLAILTCGGSLRADWTADHRLYLTLKGEIGRTFSNDPAEEAWVFSAVGGLEISR